MKETECPQLSHWRAALIFWTVHEMRLLTVSTDSTVSLAVGKLLTNIWKATVRRDPPTLWESPFPFEVVGPGEPGPSGMMTKPEGRRATEAESPPLMTTCMAGMSTGAYTTSDPPASMHVSCNINMLLWFAFMACTQWTKENKNPLENLPFLNCWMHKMVPQGVRWWERVKMGSRKTFIYNMEKEKARKVTSVLYFDFFKELTNRNLCFISWYKLSFIDTSKFRTRPF